MYIVTFYYDDKYYPNTRYYDDRNICSFRAWAN